ncbi:metalloregulator ArsR/SmtB family transcription factor [bacterium]|nr:metalloregulator ArsR/SmtB family transcription factor [bacterium]
MHSSDLTPTRKTCSPKPRVQERPLLSSEKASEVVGLYKIFANETRLRLLHALVRDGELCVSDLSRVLGMKSQTVSNQLQRLVDWGIVRSRRSGIQIHYRIIDPCVEVLLTHGLCLIEESHEPIDEITIPESTVQAN